MSEEKTEIKDIPIDYLTADYQGYFKLMKEAIPTLTPEWTDTTDTDQGIVILQLLSYGLHVLDFKNERAMRENILELAKTKKGILTNSNFLGYHPSRQTASVGTVTFYKDSDFSGRKVFIPKGFKVSTNPEVGKPIIFETQEDLIIDPSEEEGKVMIKQGVTQKRDVIGTGSGKKNQRVIVPIPDVLIETLEVSTIDNGIIRVWKRVDNFLQSKPNSRHYTVSLDEEDRTIINFGDGILGRILNNNEYLYATYAVGGGNFTNLSEGLINYIYETDFNYSAISHVRNNEKTQGGQDYESVEVTKIQAPKHYRSRLQAVTPTDFEDISELTTGVQKAKVVESFTTNNLEVYIIADGYTLASEGLCKEVKKRLDSNRVGNVNVIVKPCSIKQFDIKERIYIHENFDAKKVAEEVEKELRKVFSSENYNFNAEFYKSKVIDVSFNVAGVKNVILDEEITKDITSGDTEILKLRNVEIEVG